MQKKILLIAMKQKNIILHKTTVHKNDHYSNAKKYIICITILQCHWHN